LKTRADIRALAELQARLIASAARTLKPGGRLVYCVCSLEPEEGEGAVAAALAGGAPLARDPIEPSEIEGLPSEAFAKQGALLTLPSFWRGEGGMDGFHVSRLRRT
jgi:16S rRNA (cytosine967-C5)-methyltransferase